jgi:hypothetical protein
MKKNDIFTFTAPNGVEVTAVVINELSYRVIAGEAATTWICYAQNRLFTYKMIQDIWDKSKPIEYHYGEILVDYCILPDYDDMLEAYSDHLVTLAEEQSNM